MLYVGEVHLDFDDDARDAHRFIAKFRPDARWGYFDVFDMEDELSRTLGVPVQILSRDGIKKGRESAFRIQDAAVLHRD
ncbi:MAG: hypothetical protein H6685_05610 [Deltaproteobacteria bacterium]|nr:hypothetical protein [Deltaproteobacteria bacterium]